MAKRKYPYRCRICGCFLDPGEGNVCTDCQEEQAAEERGREMQGRDSIPVTDPVPGAYIVTGICPFCGQEYDFQAIGWPKEEALKKWAIQKCDCLEARWERIAQAEARRKRRKQSDVTY